MQFTSASAVFAILLSLASGTEFLSRPSGSPEQEEQDASAIRRLEGLQRLDEEDSAALAAAAKLGETHAEADDEEAEVTEEDADALKKVSQLEYNMRIARAKKELHGSPSDEAAAEGAAALEEDRDLRDAQQMKSAAVALKEDAVAERQEVKVERTDSRAIALAAAASMSHEEADARALEGMAKQERSMALADELSDARGLKAAAQQEESRAEAELSEADEEEKDAEAIKQAATLDYKRRITQAETELRGSPDDARAAKQAAAAQEGAELADARSLGSIAMLLRKDAGAADEEAWDTGADAAAIKRVADLTEHRQK